MKDVVNILQEADVSDADWERLGLQLKIKQSYLKTISKNRGEASLCMQDTISYWLQIDVDQSWKKLADAVEKVIGKVPAQHVLLKSGKL